ncbi:hypothetical protein CJF30_00003986 [Rutstroemia sp. NJR-2017a BBW]|nr:hypothetical protein CJF30_00003986 [Rutstroemia sp. NJR-2017a BBW]
MRRPSYHKSERTHDGLETPTTSPEFSTPIGSYFSIKRAKKGASDESSAKSPFFRGGSKRKKSTTTTTEEQPTPDSKPRSPNVDDWNVTRIYDAKPPTTSSIRSPPPRPRTHDSTSDWCTQTTETRAVTLNHTVDPPRPARDGHEWRGNGRHFVIRGSCRNGGKARGLLLGLISLIRAVGLGLRILARRNRREDCLGARFRRRVIGNREEDRIAARRFR